MKIQKPNRTFGTDLLIICALVALAFSQPLLSNLGSAGTFFVAHGAQSSHLIFFAFLASIAIPVMIGSIGYFIKIVSGNSTKSNDLYKIFFDAIILSLGFLFGLTSLQKILSFSPVLTIICALIVTIAIWVLINRVQIFNSFLKLMSVLIVLAPIVFLGFTQSSGIIWKKTDAGDILKEETTSENSITELNSDTPVVMVVFDEFNPISLLNSNKKIDAVRFPNFHRLQQKTTWYPNASSMHVQSLKAIPSILTGMKPVRNDPLPTYNDYPNNLFTKLEKTHNLNVVETITVLCPQEKCSGNRFNPGFQSKEFWADIFVITKHLYYPETWAKSYLPSLDVGWKNFRTNNHKQAPKNAAEALVEFRRQNFTKNDLFLAFENFTSDIDSEKNALHFIHTVLPHRPWIYLPNGQKYYGDEMGGDWKTQTEADEGYHRYLMQVGAMDTLIGDLIDRLEEKQIFDDSLIIITADHGLVFKNHIGKRGVHPAKSFFETRATVLSVPLFIKYPNQTTPKTDARFVQNIDLLPTIIDVLGGDSKSKNYEGQSLIANEYIEKEKIEFFMGVRKIEFKKEHILSDNALPNRIEKFGENTTLDKLSINGKHSNSFPNGYKYLIALNVQSALSPKMNLYLDGFKDISNNDDFLPLFINTEIQFSKPSDKDFQIALVLNKEIVAIVPALGRGQYRRVKTLLPPGFLKEGPNALEAFLISDGDNKDPIISEVHIQDASPTLKGDYRNIKDPIGYNSFNKTNTVIVLGNNAGIESYAIKTNPSKPETEDNGYRVRPISVPEALKSDKIVTASIAFKESLQRKIVTILVNVTKSRHHN